MQQIPTPPEFSLALSELPRAGWESIQLAGQLGRLARKHRGGDGHPVLALPGYGGADGSMAVLRHFLKRIGYTPYALELGRNIETPEERIRSVDDATRFRESMVSAVVERIKAIHEIEGEAVSLVGWSMGGLYALDASRELPHLTRQVITLGSPFGDPRGTSMFNLLRKLSRSQVAIEDQDFQGWLGKARDGAVPTHVVYSEQDGIVGTDCARLPQTDWVQHHAVDSSHIAFAINPRALDKVARLLKEITQ